TLRARAARRINGVDAVRSADRVKTRPAAGSGHRRRGRCPARSRCCNGLVLAQQAALGLQPATQVS
ncbi:hypothetical protein, partial [Vibrio alginolyticus]|uniref:hypothetical protein n=1 Tax=Vibrio alginolyticus TaxID=663 RepID=UPI001A901F4B